MVHWRCYRGNAGALVNMSYGKHTAHLLHRVTHNHYPEVREAAAIRIKAAKRPAMRALGGYWHSTVCPAPIAPAFWPN